MVVPDESEWSFDDDEPRSAHGWRRATALLLALVFLLPVAIALVVYVAFFLHRLILG